MAKEMQNVEAPSPPSLIQRDPYLAPYEPVIRRRYDHIRYTEHRLTGGRMSLPDFASGHEYFGLHRDPDGSWILREWAPNACSIALIGDFNQWKPGDGYYFLRNGGESGVWELRLPADRLKHKDLFKLLVSWPGGSGERIPAYVRRAVQDENTKVFSAQVWWPEQPHVWKNKRVRRNEAPRIYEAHVGMAQNEPRLGTYREFEEKVLPRIVDAGYNTIQLMAIQEHPYYGSFGYHVSNFFAASSRFGTPEELKSLVDAAHGAGLTVIMDLVNSHCVRNELEGLSRMDGTLYQYFHEGPRGNHVAWDSRCFNYGKIEVLHFLLSNCRFWLDEFRFDGFRFDGVTSMLYYDHGLGKAFTNYDDYFGPNGDAPRVAVSSADPTPAAP